MILFLKSHVAGYTRKDGTYVRPYFDKRTKDTHTADLFAEPEKKVLFAEKPLDSYQNLGKNKPIGLTNTEKKVEKEHRIEYKTSGGNDVSIRVKRDYDRVSVISYLDGKYQATAQLSPLLPHEIGKVPAGVVATIGKVGLRQDKLDLINAAKKEVQAEIDADPEVKMRGSIKEREALARDIAYIVEAAHEDHVSRVERMSANGFAGKSKRDYAAYESVAREKLAKFDADNPDVIAKIKKDHASDIQRWSNN